MGYSISIFFTILWLEINKIETAAVFHLNLIVGVGKKTVSRFRDLEDVFPSLLLEFLLSPHRLNMQHRCARKMEKKGFWDNLDTAKKVRGEEHFIFFKK